MSTVGIMIVPPGFTVPGSGTGGVDADSVHTNTPSEIIGVVDKLTPSPEDHMLIEDSEDGGAKKDIQLKSLPVSDPAMALFNLMASSLNPQGAWNAATNTPDITSTTQTGYFWIVDTDGTTNVGGINEFKANDWIVKMENGWAKIDNTDKVLSVAGKVGNISLTPADVQLDQVDNTSDANKPISDSVAEELVDKNKIMYNLSTGAEFSEIASNISINDLINYKGVTYRSLTGNTGRNYPDTDEVNFKVESGTSDGLTLIEATMYEALV